jgi:hypothetical protein
VRGADIRCRFFDTSSDLADVTLIRALDEVDLGQDDTVSFSVRSPSGRADARSSGVIERGRHGQALGGDRR